MLHIQEMGGTGTMSLSKVKTATLAAKGNLLTISCSSLPLITIVSSCGHPHFSFHANQNAQLFEFLHPFPSALSPMSLLFPLSFEIVFTMLAMLVCGNGVDALFRQQNSIDVEVPERAVHSCSQ